jgi:xanthine dehydrogenase YagS FAD-binding subunit
MRPFTYERATDSRAAVTAGSRGGAKFISGGTNLLDLMKLEIERPSHLVDISRLPLKDIETLPDGGLRIGAQAATSCSAPAALTSTTRNDFKIELARRTLCRTLAQVVLAR